MVSKSCTTYLNEIINKDKDMIIDLLKHEVFTACSVCKYRGFNNGKLYCKLYLDKDIKDNWTKVGCDDYVRVVTEYDKD